MKPALRQTTLNYICALIVALCALIYIRTSVVRPISLFAAPAIFSLFTTPRRSAKAPTTIPAFFYPPLLVFLMVPLALAPYVAARWISSRFRMSS